jgi:adenylate cyclase class IV
MSHNLELKARCSNLRRARKLARDAGARFVSTIDPSDFYFFVPSGRLKLRTIREAGKSRSELIWYRRPDKTAARISAYCIVPVRHPSSVKGALAAALGVRAVVRKRRELWMHHNIRIHLDEVRGLGRFIEFEAEAVLSANDDARTSRRRLRTLCTLMRVRRSDLLPCSYVDMLADLGATKPK